MDAEGRLTALKKAYADIILNTAKEAAARIMLSERKAIWFQHELSVVKEEALQMFLRLKHMMDSEIGGAEMTSFCQQRKIEEVEAQLQEAEDIVRDLREELKEVQAKLERVTNNKVQHHLDEHESIIASDVKNSSLNQRYEVLKCCSENDSGMGNSCVGSRYLPSISMRSKEPRLYRNGCTQRICAFERNLLDGELSLSRQRDNIRNETSAGGDEEGKGIHTTSTYKADNMFNIENKVAHAEKNWYHVQTVKSFHSRRSIRSKTWCRVQMVKSFCRKRGIRYKKITTPSFRYLLDQIMKRDQPSDISFFKTHPSSINNNGQYGDHWDEMAPRLSSDTIATGMQKGCAEVTESEAEFVKACSVQNTIDKNKLLADKPVLMRWANATADSSGDQFYKFDVEKVDVPLVNSESKPSDRTNGVSCQPVKDRIIKYTFQRKRKKECLSSSDGNGSLEKCASRRKTEEKQNSFQGTLKFSSITESN